MAPHPIRGISSENAVRFYGRSIPDIGSRGILTCPLNNKNGVPEFDAPDGSDFVRRLSVCGLGEAWSSSYTMTHVIDNGALLLRFGGDAGRSVAQSNLDIPNAPLGEVYFDMIIGTSLAYNLQRFSYRVYPGFGVTDEASEGSIVTGTLLTDVYHYVDSAGRSNTGAQKSNANTVAELIRTHSRMNGNNTSRVWDLVAYNANLLAQAGFIRLQGGVAGGLVHGGQMKDWDLWGDKDTSMNFLEDNFAGCSEGTKVCIDARDGDEVHATLVHFLLNARDVDVMSTFTINGIPVIPFFMKMRPPPILSGVFSSGGEDFSTAQRWLLRGHVVPVAQVAPGAAGPGAGVAAAPPVHVGAPKYGMNVPVITVQGAPLPVITTTSLTSALAIIARGLGDCNSMRDAFATRAALTYHLPPNQHGQGYNVPESGVNSLQVQDLLVDRPGGSNTCLLMSRLKPGNRTEIFRTCSECARLLMDEASVALAVAVTGRAVAAACADMGVTQDAMFPNYAGNDPFGAPAATLAAKVEVRNLFLMSEIIHDEVSPCPLMVGVNEVFGNYFRLRMPITWCLFSVGGGTNATCGPYAPGEGVLTSVAARFSLALLPPGLLMASAIGMAGVQHKPEALLKRLYETGNLNTSAVSTVVSTGASQSFATAGSNSVECVGGVGMLSHAAALASSDSFRLRGAEWSAQSQAIGVASQGGTLYPLAGGGSHYLFRVAPGPMQALAAANRVICMGEQLHVSTSQVRAMDYQLRITGQSGAQMRTMLSNQFQGVGIKYAMVAVANMAGGALEQPEQRMKRRCFGDGGGKAASAVKAGSGGGSADSGGEEDE